MNRPPQSLESEQCTLGAMLIERDALARASRILVAQDFYRLLHQRIFQATLYLFERGQPLGIQEVAAELSRRGQLYDVGGKEYLLALVDVCPSIAGIEIHARVVREKSELRRLDKLME